MSLILTPDHFSITSSLETARICKPLAHINYISHFVYARIYYQGKIWTLGNISDAILYHFNMQQQLSPYIPESLAKHKSFYYIPFKNGHYKSVLTNLYNHFDLDSCIILFKRFESYIEAFTFFSSPKYSTEIVFNYYLNNLDLLEKYILYFKYRAKHLIIQSEKHKFQIPEKMMPPIPDHLKTAYAYYEQLVNVISDKYSSLADYLSNIDFTPKEIIILQQIGKGATVYQIAEKFNLSPRTVESHINNIKAKLNIKKKYEAIRLMKDYMPYLFRE